MCSLAFACLSSNSLLLLTPEYRCLRNSSKNGFKIKSLRRSVDQSYDIGRKTCLQSGMFEQIIQNFFRARLSLLSSTTTLIPCLSDSSLKSDIPSIFLSLANSAILATSKALLT